METMTANSPSGNPIYGRGPELSPYSAPAMQAIPLPPQRPVTLPVPSATGSVSPGLAFILGFIPGVGAIYNGQYAKGLLHAIVFGLLISLVDHAGAPEPVLVMGLVGWIFYMPFEAFHTAKRRMMGLPVDEWSSVVRMDGGAGHLPLAPVMLIIVGFFFLLSNFNVIHLRDVVRFWPMAIIAVGIYMLMARVRSERRP